MEREDANANMAESDKPVVCVLDASTYVGFGILQGLLSKGYNVHAAVQKNGKFFSNFQCLLGGPF